ncbi:MAG: GNAT family N-acetyltransferase [Candidatus Dormibacteria bacterium]
MEEITSGEGLSGLRRTWNEVEAAGAPINPFLSWDWQYSWWEAFGQDLEVRYLVVSEPGLVLGIVPLAGKARSSGTLGFGGGADLTDHLGILARPGRESEVAGAALQHLFRAESSSRPKALDLHYLPEGSPSLQALLGAARSLELAHDLTQEEVSPRVALGETFDDYLNDRLNKKDRHELRRKLRRLDTEQPGWRLVSQRELGLERALDEFFPVLRASGPHKVEFLTPRVEAFMRDVSRRMEEREWLRLQFLEIGGNLSAATLGFTVSGTWHLYNSGYQPDLAPLSPGLLCVAEGIRVALQEGCHTADFLRGSEAYKYHLGGVDHPLLRLQLRASRAGEGPR